MRAGGRVELTLRGTPDRRVITHSGVHLILHSFNKLVLSTMLCWVLSQVLNEQKHRPGVGRDGGNRTGNISALTELTV